MADYVPDKIRTEGHEQNSSTTDIRMVVVLCVCPSHLVPKAVLWKINIQLIRFGL